MLLRADNTLRVRRCRLGSGRWASSRGPVRRYCCSCCSRWGRCRRIAGGRGCCVGVVWFGVEVMGFVVGRVVWVLLERLLGEYSRCSSRRLRLGWRRGMVGCWAVGGRRLSRPRGRLGRLGCASLRCRALLLFRNRELRRELSQCCPRP